MRAHILFRDKLTCLHCGLKVEDAGCGYRVTVNPKKYPVKSYYDYVPLVVDHIVPVVVDPEKEFDESNLQTLCLWCNKVKTSRDLRRIWQRRKAREPLPNPFNVSIELPLKEPFVQDLEMYLS